MKRVVPMFTCFLPLAFSRKRRNSNDSTPHAHPVPRSLPRLCAPEPSMHLPGSSDSAAELVEVYGGTASTPVSQAARHTEHTEPAELRNPSEAPASEGNSSSCSNPLVSEELVRCPSRPSPHRTTSLSRSSRSTVPRLRSLVSRSARLGCGRGDSDSYTSSGNIASGTCVDDSRRVGSQAATYRSHSRAARSDADDSIPLLDGSEAGASDDSSFDDEHSDGDEDNDDAEVCILDTLDSQAPGQLRPRRRRPTRPRTPPLPNGYPAGSSSAAASADIDRDNTVPSSQSNALYASKEFSVELDLGGATADAAALLSGAGSPVLPQVPPPFGTVLQGMQHQPSGGESLGVPSSTEDSLLRLSLNVSSFSATGSHSSYAASPLQHTAAHPPPLLPLPLATEPSCASQAPARPYGRFVYPHKLGPGLWAPHRGRGGLLLPHSGPQNPNHPPAAGVGHHIYRRMNTAAVHGGMPQWQHHMPDASVVSSASNATVSASNTSSPITTPRSCTSHIQHLASFGSWLHPAGSVMSPSLITDTPDVSARYSINDSDLLRNNLTSGLSSHESAMVIHQTDSLALFMESTVLPMPADAIDESAFDDAVNVGTAAAAAGTGKHLNANAATNFATRSVYSESLFAVGDAPSRTDSGSYPLVPRTNKSTAEKLGTLSFSSELVVATFGNTKASFKSKDKLMSSVQPPVSVERHQSMQEGAPANLAADVSTHASGAVTETSPAIFRASSTGGASLNLYPAENQVDLAPAARSASGAVPLQPPALAVRPPLVTQSSGVLSQNSVNASIAMDDGEDADTECPGDGARRIRTPSFPPPDHPTRRSPIHPTLLARELEDSESAKLLETALVMAGSKASSSTAGGLTLRPPPHTATTQNSGLNVATPQAQLWSQPSPPSPCRASAGANCASAGAARSQNTETQHPAASKQDGAASNEGFCAVCQKEAPAGGVKGWIRLLPEELCRSGGGLCEECFGKAVSEARALMLRGMQFLCPCRCGQRWTHSPMSRFASLAPCTPLPVPLPPLAPSNSSTCEPPSESDASDDSCSLNSSPAEPPTTPMPRMMPLMAKPLTLPGVPESNLIATSAPSPTLSSPPRAPGASPDSPISAQALCAAAAAAASVLRRPPALNRHRSLGQLHLDQLPTLEGVRRSTSLPSTPEREATAHPSPSFAGGSDSHSSRNSDRSASHRLAHSRSHFTLPSPRESASSGDFPSAPLQPPAALPGIGGLPTPRFGIGIAATAAATASASTAPAVALASLPSQRATPVDTPQEAISAAAPQSSPPSPTRPPMHRHANRAQSAVRLPPRPRSIPMPPLSAASTSAPPNRWHASPGGSYIPRAPRSFMPPARSVQPHQRGSALRQPADNTVRGYSAPPRQPHRLSSNGSSSSLTAKNQAKGPQLPRAGARSEDSLSPQLPPRTRHVFRGHSKASSRLSATHSRSTSAGSVGQRPPSSHTSKSGASTPLPIRHSYDTFSSTAHPPANLDSLDGASLDGPVAESACSSTTRPSQTPSASDVMRTADAAARAAHHIASVRIPKEDPRTPPPRRSSERHLRHTNPVALPPTAPSAAHPRSRSTRSLQKLLSLPASALQCVTGGSLSPGAGDPLAAMTDFSLLNSTEHGYPEGPSFVSQGCAGKSSGVVSLDACSASVKRDQTDTLPLQALLAMEDSDSSMGAACHPCAHYKNPEGRTHTHSHVHTHLRSRRRGGASASTPPGQRSRSYNDPSEALLQSIVDECWAAATASGHLHHLVGHGRGSSTDTASGAPSTADKDFLSQCAALEEALCRTSDSSRMSRSPSLSASRAMSGSLMRQSSRLSLRQSPVHGHSSGASASLAAVASGASTSARSSSHNRLR